MTPCAKLTCDVNDRDTCFTENTCTCTNGIGTTGIHCITHKGADCASCDDGYTLVQHTNGMSCETLPADSGSGSGSWQTEGGSGGSDNGSGSGSWQKEGGSG